jgi:hypothetical protein
MGGDVDVVLPVQLLDAGPEVSDWGHDAVVLRDGTGSQHLSCTDASGRSRIHARLRIRYSMDTYPLKNNGLICIWPLWLIIRYVLAH